MNSEGGGVPSIANTLTTPGTFIASAASKLLHLAAQHRRTRHDGIQHPGQARVDAVLRLAVDDAGPSVSVVSFLPM